jgi:hypothetical protein
MKPVCACFDCVLRAWCFRIFLVALVLAIAWVGWCFLRDRRRFKRRSR